MTGPVTGEPGRGTKAPTRTASTRNAASAILIVLALGLAFRLILAHVLPGSGFRVDRIAFHFWANNLATDGLFGFYQRDFFHDYTPGYRYSCGSWVTSRGSFGESWACSPDCR